jgi:hypothetical protein
MVALLSVSATGVFVALLLWAAAALAFGLTTGLCGNAWRFGSQVARGGLDFFLVLPTGPTRLSGLRREAPRSP